MNERSRNVQARNSRMKRLSESLSMGFPVSTEDEFGNTLLLIAAQNVRAMLFACVFVGCSHFCSVTGEPEAMRNVVGPWRGCKSREQGW